jgi:hypothetical protein
MFFQIFLVELTEFIHKHLLLYRKSKDIQRLAPLVGNIAYHLTHGCLAILQNEHAFVLAKRFDSLQALDRRFV